MQPKTNILHLCQTEYTTLLSKFGCLGLVLLEGSLHQKRLLVTVAERTNTEPLVPVDSVHPQRKPPYFHRSLWPILSYPDRHSPQPNTSLKVTQTILYFSCRTQLDHRYVSYYLSKNFCYVYIYIYIYIYKDLQVLQFYVFILYCLNITKIGDRKQRAPLDFIISSCIRLFCIGMPDDCLITGRNMQQTYKS